MPSLKFGQPPSEHDTPIDSKGVNQLKQLRGGATMMIQESKFSGGGGYLSERSGGIYTRKSSLGSFSIDDDEEMEKEEQLMRYRFLALFIENSIKLFPRSVSLRIHNSNIQSSKLQNEFKAIFELMKSDQLDPNIQNRFFIFRERINIQRKIISKNQRNLKDGEKVDPLTIYTFEKLYQRFIKHSYFAANSALAFWRELLQKNIDSQLLQDRGTDISKHYEKIQDLAESVNKVAPNEIKFLLQYATFLKQIVHNEYEAQLHYEKACHSYSRMIPDKSRSGGATSGEGGSSNTNGTEKALFGENTALAMIMVALSAEKVGQIVHTNDEIMRVLGYTRKQLIDKNVSVIQPTPIGAVHDNFLRGFLETTKLKLLNHILQMFAVTADGYLKPINLMLKLYPQMQDRIIIIGFIQTMEKIDGLEPPRQLSGVNNEDLLLSLPHHYILTDHNGAVACVSEGLWHELGLNSKFFMQGANTNSHVTQVHIEAIFDDPIATNSDLQELLVSDGIETVVNTMNLFEHVNLESISQQEAIESIQRQGQYVVHVQLKRYNFAQSSCIVDLYRIVILPKQLIQQKLANKDGNKIDVLTWGNISLTAQQQIALANAGVEDSKNAVLQASTPHGPFGGKPTNGERNSYQYIEKQGFSDSGDSLEITSMSQSSTGSSFSNRIAYSNIIQEFKNAIEKRRTPRNLVILSRAIIVIISLTIAVSSIDYYLKSQYITQAQDLTEQLVQGQSRTIKLIQLVQNIRSFVNVANDIEFHFYANENLKRIDRFKYLRQLIQSEAGQLQTANDYLSQQRQNDYGSQQQTSFENKPISLYRLSSYNTFSQQNTPYRQALNTFLNDILELDVTDDQSLKLPEFLLQGAPPLNTTAIQKNNSVTSSQMEKELYFILANGIRQLRARTQEVEDRLIREMSSFSINQGVYTFLAIMVIGMAINTVSLVIVVYQIMHLERSKQEIMSIFALFTPDQLKRVYHVCDSFIDRIDRGGPADDMLYFIKDKQQMLYQSNEFSNSIAMTGNMSRRNNRGTKQAKQKGGADDLFVAVMPTASMEEIKEESEAQSILRKRDIANYRSLAQAMTAREYYGKMLHKTLMQLKEEIYVKEPTPEELSKPDYAKSLNAAISKQAPNTSAAKSAKKGMKESEEKNEKNGLIGKMFKGKKDKKAKKDDLSMLEIENNGVKKVGFSKGAKKQGKEDGTPPGKIKRKGSKKIMKRFFVNNSKESFDSTTSRLKLHLDEDKGSKKGDNDEDNSQSSRSDAADGESHRQLHDFESSQRRSRHHHHHHSGDLKGSKSMTGEDDENNPESEIRMRKKLLSHTSKERKKKCWNAIMLNGLVSVFFYGYFIYSYVFHKIELDTLNAIQESTPMFFNRYQSLFLQYQLLREGIINQNQNYDDLILFLPSFVENEQKLQIDEFYHQTSMKVESDISKLITSGQKGLELLLSFIGDVDTEKFCSKVFAIYQKSAEEKLTVTKNAAQKLAKIRREAYQVEIDTVIAATSAASEGKLELLKALKSSRGVDLNIGDYDNRTPLHVSCGAGHYEIVKYLVEEVGVDVSPVDRWGATPLCDAQPYPEIKQLLLKHGAVLGKLQPPYQALVVTITEDQFRLYYAAFYGNTAIMDNLRLLGWNVNGQDYDGRTALGVAASEGQLEAVKYLISKGADLSIKDARGNDPLDDARRQNRSAVVDYLINEALVRNFCNEFEEGLFVKGLAQAIGVFNRKFSDLQILVGKSKNKTTLYSFLGGPNYLSNSSNSTQTDKSNSTNNNKTKSLLNTNNQSPTERILQVFLSCEELYIFKVIELQIEVLQKTYHQYGLDYKSFAQLSFFVFMAIQIVTMLILRKRFIMSMREDVMQSRGILNLVPEGFFKEHQQAVEKVIKMMKA